MRNMAEEVEEAVILVVRRWAGSAESRAVPQSKSDLRKYIRNHPILFTFYVLSENP